MARGGLIITRPAEVVPDWLDFMMMQEEALLRTRKLELVGRSEETDYMGEEADSGVSSMSKTCKDSARKQQKESFHFHIGLSDQGEIQSLENAQV